MDSSPPLDELTADHFKDCKGHEFRLEVGGQPISLTLDQVSSLKGDTSREDKSPFSLVFKGPADAYFAQQTMALYNETLGNLHLFLVPLGPDPDDEKKLIQYEAIFT